MKRNTGNRCLVTYMYMYNFNLFCDRRQNQEEVRVNLLEAMKNFEELDKAITDEKKSLAVSLEIYSIVYVCVKF